MLTIALLVAAHVGFLWLLNALGAQSWITETIGEVSWVGSLLNLSSLILMLTLSFVLMSPVASAITSMFLDEIADAVEARHYPHLPDAPNFGFWGGLRDTVNFFGIFIAANIIALILAAMTSVLVPFIFRGTNGYLLRREYFLIAGKRRMPLESAKAFFHQHRAKVWGAGCLMAIPLTVPLVNLFIPVLGAATFTHQLHRLNGTRKRR